MGPVSSIKKPKKLRILHHPFRIRWFLEKSFSPRQKMTKETLEAEEEEMEEEKEKKKKKKEKKKKKR